MSQPIVARGRRRQGKKKNKLSLVILIHLIDELSFSNVVMRTIRPWVSPHFSNFLFISGEEPAAFKLMTSAHAHKKQALRRIFSEEEVCVTMFLLGHNCAFGGNGEGEVPSVGVGGCYEWRWITNIHIFGSYKRETDAGFGQCSRVRQVEERGGCWLIICHFVVLSSSYLFYMILWCYIWFYDDYLDGGTPLFLHLYFDSLIENIWTG